MLENARDVAEKIIVIGITPVIEKKTSPIGNLYFNNKSIGEYNKALRNLCNLNKIVFIDLFKKWTKHEYEQLFTSDGIHPNENGHEDIFNEVKNIFLTSKGESISSGYVLKT